MNTSELREQTIEELQNRLDDIKKKIFNLRFQKATGQLENPMSVRNLKKEVAVIKTLIREKQLGINQQEGFVGKRKKKTEGRYSEKQ